MAFIPITRNTQNQAEAALFWHDVKQSLSNINLCTSVFYNISYNPGSNPPSTQTMRRGLSTDLVGRWKENKTEIKATTGMRTSTGGDS